MAEVVWTRESVAWLEKIHDHIAVEDPTAALKVVVESILRSNCCGRSLDWADAKCRSRTVKFVRSFTVTTRSRI